MPIDATTRRAGGAILAAALLVAGPATRAEDAVETAETEVSRAADDWSRRLIRLAEAMEWTDQVVRHDWRVQSRAGSDAARLLDPADGTVCTGTVEECLERLEGLAAQGHVPDVTGHAVILLHGLGEGRGSMRPLADHLRERHDATVLSFGYASPRAGIDDHARALGRVVAGLPSADRVSFVAHSLGNIVVRRWMADAPESDRSRLHRMVMLGAPNQGSQMARTAARSPVLAGLSTGAARELVLDWPRIAASLTVPPCPFGIVAGGAGDGEGYSTLLDGDDDAVVRVDETRLDGADDFVLIPVRHAFMMADPAVQQATSTFLETGRFPAGEAGVPRPPTVTP